MCASRNQYSLDIIDDCSNYVWTVPVHLKDQAAAEVKRWLTSVEAEHEVHVKEMQIDGGGV